MTSFSFRAQSSTHFNLTLKLPRNPICNISQIDFNHTSAGIETINNSCKSPSSYVSKHIDKFSFVRWTSSSPSLVMMISSTYTNIIVSLTSHAFMNKLESTSATKYLLCGRNTTNFLYHAHSFYFKLYGALINMQT